MSELRRSWLYLAVLLVLVTATAAHCAPAATDSAARRTLEQMVAAYRHLQTYQEEGVFIYAQAMPGLQMRMDLHYGLAYVAPNHLHYERGPGMPSVEVVCDGKNAYLSVPLAGRVVKAPAPQDARVLLASQTLSSASMGIPAATDSTTFLRGGFDMSQVVSVRSGMDARNPWLRSLASPPGTVTVTVVIGHEPATVLWIDRQTHTLRQVASDRSSGGLAEKMGEPGAAPWLADVFKNLTIRTFLAAHKVAVDKTIPNATFAFTPAKGMPVVEAKSVSDLAAALRSGQGGEEGPSTSEGRPEEQASFVGRAPLEFTAQDLDGGPVAFSSFKGKPLVLDFCATWCPPCRAELPVLDEYYGKLKDQGLQAIAVFIDEKVDAVKAFVKDHPLGFRALWLDPAGDEWKRLAKAYRIAGIPRTLYVGTDWSVKADNTGFSGKEEILKSLAAIGMKAD